LQDAQVLSLNRPWLEGVTSTVFAGVIVLFMSDETLPTVFNGALALVCGAILIALPLTIAARRILTAFVWSPSALLQELTVERPWLGALLPARCPIRSTSVSVRAEPPDRFRSRAGSGLRGWQSGGR
jgi:hypothetical protein